MSSFCGDQEESERKDIYVRRLGRLPISTGTDVLYALPLNTKYSGYNMQAYGGKRMKERERERERERENNREKS